MATFARRLLEAGKSQYEVLEACYGVPFPEETFALAELIAEGREPSALYILRGDFYEYAGVMLCYRLDDLAAGLSTIWGFQSDLMDDAAVAQQYGDSLAAVIHADCADTVRRVEKEYASPYNRGAGSLDKAELDGAREDLACAAELIRRTAERRRPRLVP